MPGAAKLALELRRELELGHPLARVPLRPLGDVGEHRGGASDLLELPRRLDGPHAAKNGRAVGKLEAEEPPRVLEVERGRKDVELESETTALEPRRREHARQVAQRGEGLHVRERGLLPRAL